MTPFRLVLRSLRFHARTHAGAFLGAVIGTAVLVGALAVGDSVRESLRKLAMLRLGRTDLALSSGDRFFRASLATDLITTLDNVGAPALQLLAAASGDGGARRANRVQLLGVDGRFWSLADQTPRFRFPTAGEVVLNERLAEQLQATPGDSIVLRVPKPTGLSREAPISPQEDYAVALRVTIHAIASDEEFGRFSLQASQIPPFNAFVSLDWLQEQLELPGRANLMLLLSDKDPWASAHATAALRRTWRLADAELELRELPEAGVLELRSNRVFLDPPIADAALAASPAAGGLLTYFVNELRAGSSATPYSMVTAGSQPLLPDGVTNDEIVINHWLARDLSLKPGDELVLRYFVVSAMRRLEERTNTFRVHSVVPLEAPFADRALMPDFPGMVEAQNCRDWDTGFPIELDRIRSQDNEYWEKFKGTPKAFVTLAAGQAMWGNRFGELTAVRYPLAGTDRKATEEAILRSLDPAALGFSFQPVRQQAQASVEQAQDFGQLFLGFSLFLLIAALLLMALLFQFGIERRATEVGTLLALGFTPQHVRRLLLWEAGLLALIGSVLGMFAGTWYARAMVYGLATVWRDAAGTSALRYHAEPLTLGIGAAAGTLIAWLTLGFALRTQARRPARELLSQGAELFSQAPANQAQQPQRGLLLGFGGVVLTSILIGMTAVLGEGPGPGAFFGAGALLLLSGLGFSTGILGALMHSETAASPSLLGLGVRNATRRRTRSLATIALLASGSFLVIAIGAFRLEAEENAMERTAGTGGFALLGESSFPIVHDLNGEEGRQFFGLDTNELAGVAVVPFRVREGDDASCLNLNRAQKPRLLAVQPALLHERKAFSFAKVEKGHPSDHPWRLLEETLAEEAVPAIGDQASIQWALGKKVGDTIEYTDGRGEPFKVRLVASLANSILQGSLVIAETNFVQRFPDESGYRMFLIDAPSNQVETVSSALGRGLRDLGLELTPAARRLNEFNAVQNTYLNTFQVLGGLGLLLGSVGLGVVVLRNVLERRGEFALMVAVGFRRSALRWLVLSEHAALLLAGLALGILAAAVAVMPVMFSTSGQPPPNSLLWTLLGVLASGIAWTWVAARLALRGKLLEALRNE